MSAGSDFPPGNWNLTTHPQETLVCRKYPSKQSKNLPPRKWGEQEKTLWKINFSLDYPPPGNIFSSNTPWKFLQALSCPLEMLKYPPSPRKISRIKCSPSPLNYGEEHPQLLVSGGRDKDGNTLRDLWVLDVEAGTWKEVR